MKKIILFILFLLLVNCDYLLIMRKDIPYYDLDIDLEIQGNTDNEKMESIKRWIYHNILSMSDIEIFGITDYWQTPEETVKNGEGDCEDMCILFQWLCFQYLGIKPRMLILQNIGGAHAIAKYNNYLFYDIRNDYIKGNYIYIDYYSWEDSLRIAEYIK